MGLRQGNDPRAMQAQPGAVMGAFAWGHPFLDGTGRTMLVVHAELCYRAGFSIDWSASSKDAYLDALTLELQDPHGKHLDAYLLPLVTHASYQGALLDHLKALPGLDGQGSGRDQNVAYQADDRQAIQFYLETKQARGEILPGEN